MNTNAEIAQQLLDQLSSGTLSRRRFLGTVSATGLAAGLSGATIGQAIAAGENQQTNQAQLKPAYDYIVVGAGSAGCVVAGELSKTGADVLIVESGGPDIAPTISNTSVWVCHVGSAPAWELLV